MNGRRWLAWITALAITVLVAGLTRVPVTTGNTDAAEVQLSWRLRGARVEECRTRTADELARLPVHMRQTEVCEPRLVPYVLTVEVDGQVAVRDTIEPAGARGDRPLSVMQSLDIQPGRRALRVSFAPAPDATGGTTLALDTVIVMRPGTSALVLLDEAGRLSLLAE